MSPLGFPPIHIAPPLVGESRGDIKLLPPRCKEIRDMKYVPLPAINFKSSSDAPKTCSTSVHPAAPAVEHRARSYYDAFALRSRL